MQDIFDIEEAQKYIDRIDNLTPESTGNWGQMSVNQMLAHCNVTYELVYEPDKHKKLGSIAKFFMKKFVKSKVTNTVPYKQNLPTGPMFRITDEKSFQEEKSRLTTFVLRVQEDGSKIFEGKESSSFGKLSAQEWNNLFAKHLNHHLEQFSV